MSVNSIKWGFTWVSDTVLIILKYPDWYLALCCKRVLNLYFRYFYRIKIQSLKDCKQPKNVETSIYKLVFSRYKSLGHKNKRVKYKAW